VIYNLADSGEDETAANLADLLGAELAPLVPDWAKATTSPKVSSNTDVLIILGQDRKDL